MLANRAGADAVRSERRDVASRLRLVWKEQDPKQIAETVCALVCLRLVEGRERRTPQSLNKATFPLGRTHISDGEIPPFCEVDIDRVETILAVTGERAWAVRHQRL